MKTQIIKIISCLVAGFILSACVGAVNVPDGAVEPVHPCIANPFEDTCGGAEFNDARKVACVGSNSNQCAPIIMRVCEADSLDALCADRETYYPAQKTACGDEPDSKRCALTITRVCDIDSLDALCADNQTYYSAQETACMDEPNSSRCHQTLDRVCGVNLFGTLCQLANLTMRHLPLPSNVRSGSIRGGQPTDAPYGSCYGTYGTLHYSCYVVVPESINIKPLNNTNTGTAIYAGSVVAQHAANNRTGCRQGTDRCFYNYHSNITKDIDIIVDFDNNTLSYSGDLTLDNLNPRKTHVFNINGNFTDRGILTGTVDFNTAETPLIGLIGQDEVIGVFASSYENQDSFAGGFTATRQPAE